ncbi:lactonase family protein [Domibacillus sp. DTU_2020_1001157_1_SI_ALB_TIR_016]|uniref:lactonase family protein n=1 Tax=Domibacillus sp. DTU_2020_1001157_1_SI_ALB_TIR_016 TaxID=3077789 RepID=UPI0028EC0A25|nr:lactonase family protein [Domibacillus sp. DTU_2020_1001157_1_SI_ALB_TIR_016]WNS80439.1 lactonase family protein [Domibacillus sp. DTU_2020_1001157_1_SI_ALB_TIR_016]
MNHTLWAGSYAKKEEPGIYKVIVDTQSETLTITNRFSGVENPSFLAEADGFLYAASESMDGKAVLFSIEPDDLILKAEADAGEMAPCHIYAEDTYAWTANYGGSVTKYERNGDTLQKTALSKHEGSGPNEERQDAPHVHSVTPFPDGRHLLVCDLGTDTLVVYDKHKLEIIKEVKAAPGAGPRMAFFHPEQPVVYVMNELDSTVSVYKVGDGGTITHLDTLAGLPAGYNGEHTGADVQISSDRRFLYGAIRGWDGLAVFDIGPDGTLSEPRHVKVDGKTPRSFYALPDEPFLVVAFQDSDEICLFKIQPNGLPVLTEGRAAVTKPVCVIKRGER